MPLLESHLDAAQLNERLARQLLLVPGGAAWAAVLAFYSALHLVDAYLSTLEVHPRSHSHRRAHLMSSVRLHPILEDYRLLESLLRDARYELRAVSVDEADQLIDEVLGRVAGVVLPLVRTPGA